MLHERRHGVHDTFAIKSLNSSARNVYYFNFDKFKSLFIHYVESQEGPRRKGLFRYRRRATRHRQPKVGGAALGVASLSITDFNHFCLLHRAYAACFELLVSVYLSIGMLFMN